MLSLWFPGLAGRSLPVSNRLTNVARLALVLGATWLLLVGPAFGWQGVLGVEGLSWAVAICLLPGLLVVTRIARVGERSPFAGLAVGMGLRLAVAVASAFVVWYLCPDLGGAALIVWLVPCYLVALAVETRMLLDDEAGLESVSTSACRT